jgi:membrane protease YdiL (CAAX protease family)
MGSTSSDGSIRPIRHYGDRDGGLVTEKSFVQRHAVLLYFVLVFLISWLGSYLAIGTRFLQGGVPELSDIGLMAIPMLGAPFGVGILMSYLADGRKGLKDLFSRMMKWKVGGRWYLPLVIFPILLISVLLVLSVVVSPKMAPSFVVPFIIIGLVGGSLEETGWMGFALPRMSLQRSILGPALLLGIIHGVWHFFADFLANYGAMGGYYWLLYNVGFFTHVVALRVLIAWVYANTDSLFLAMMMHGSSTGFYGFFTYNLVNPELRAIFYLVYGVVLWVPAIAVTLKYGKSLKA